jgi:prophage maintenance system killer protein
VTLRVDLAWLLAVAQQSLRGDPAIDDWGALTSAVFRHRSVLWDIPIYSEPHHRAAALAHSLIRVPAFEAGNRAFAMATAVAYLTADGLKVDTTGPRAASLARAIEGGMPVREAAAELKGWILD